jgi:2,4-dichlorophenol 6-monooxygenase
VAPGRWLLVTSSAEWAAAGEGSADGPLPLDVVLVGRDVLDDTGAWAEVSGTGSAGAVLVRPDQHVAWRSPGPSDDPEGILADALAQLAGRSVVA